LVESRCEKFPTLIFDRNTDELHRIKTILLIFDVLDDKGMSTIAFELAGEFQEVLELVGFVLVRIMRTRMS